MQIPIHGDVIDPKYEEIVQLLLQLLYLQFVVMVLEMAMKPVTQLMQQNQGGEMVDVITNVIQSIFLYLVFLVLLPVLNQIHSLYLLLDFVHLEYQ